MTDEHPNIQRIRRVLDEQGGIYSWEDILAELEAGTLQSFTEGSSSVFTSIRQYPRKKVLDVRLAVGTLDEIYAIQPRVVAFAKEQGCDLLQAFGRHGWLGVKTPGWERVASVYIRRL